MTKYSSHQIITLSNNIRVIENKTLLYNGPQQLMYYEHNNHNKRTPVVVYTQ